MEGWNGCRTRPERTSRAGLLAVAFSDRLSFFLLAPFFPARSCISSQSFFSFAARKVQCEQTISELSGLMKRSRLFSPYIPPFLSFMCHFCDISIRNITIYAQYRSHRRKSENIYLYICYIFAFDIKFFEYLFFISRIFYAVKSIFAGSIFKV